MEEKVTPPSTSQTASLVEATSDAEMYYQPEGEAESFNSHRSVTSS